MPSEHKFIDVSTLPRNTWLDGEVLVMAVSEIDNAPTVDAIEVVHAKWERNEHDKIVCSRCKNEPLLDDFGYWVMSKYCPNCGAEMDGD